MSEIAISKLAEVLAVEERVHRDLRKLLTEERERMVKLDAESLYELATRKEILAEEGRLARDARTQAVVRLANAVGLEPDGVTLSQLCERLGDSAAPLRSAQSRLLAVVSAVAELAKANQRLGGERLTDVQATLRLLGRLAPMAEQGSAGRYGNLVRRSA